MVAGKNNAQALARSAGAPKLPPLPKLRVRKPDRADANPCIGVMSSVLGTVDRSLHGESGQARGYRRLMGLEISGHILTLAPQVAGPPKDTVHRVVPC
ncbi:hypothetical protein D0860_00014 [Hortaea werneckii]|uniref:Uncharacterized protein n=1 Tax=Hortaea werneckii TaxID=91943 RepID=A0A3M7HXL9_HORWE|nr:hypothetical protein D0860_00014 [Hortaea werneckii]